MDPADDKKNNGERNGAERMTDEELDAMGQELFLINQNALTKFTNGLKVRDTSSEKVEGKDIVRGVVLPGVFGMKTGVNTGNNTESKVEVKSVRNFLTRNGYMSKGIMDQSGTIQFEIFGIWDKDRAKPYAGWTLSLYNPEQLNAIKKLHNSPTTATRPDILAFILVDEKENPFACVAFEDITKLVNRLNQCFPEEWDFNCFNLPSLADKEYWGRYIDDKGKATQWDLKRGGMIRNMWHIPFETLAGIATVTMIGDTDPAITGDSNGVSKELQEKRLAWLKNSARDAMVIDETTGEKKQFIERRLTTKEQEQNRIAKESGTRTPVTFYGVYKRKRKQ